MTDEQFAEILDRMTYERREVEVKSAGMRTDKQLFAKVVRAALGMANRRDGGLVVVGVSEDKTSQQFNFVGLSTTELTTWRYDDVSDAFSEYADPSISFELEVRQYNGRSFVVLQIAEFSDIPVLCKKDYAEPGQGGKQILRRGACYIRSRRKPETVEIPTQEDMRDLLDLAVEKGVRRFVSQTYGAGIRLSETAYPTDSELFEQQAKNWSSERTEKIQSRGYWQVIIRPTIFVKEMIPIKDLYSLVQKTTVDLGGWYFPTVDWGRQPVYGDDWISQDIDKALSGPEAWRFYQSGQFLDRYAMWQDWRDVTGWIRPVPNDWKPGQILYMETSVRFLTGILAFGARLALSDQYKSVTNFHIEIAIVGIQDRVLAFESGRSSIPRKAAIPEYSWDMDVSREDLIASDRELAKRAAKEILLRFGGYEPADSVLMDIQAVNLN